MSYPAAIQSACFYFLACTPCAKVRHRHKAKAQAKRDREEKASLEARQPDLYKHPSPFTTNEYWREEIDMGPRLSRKAGSKNSSARRLTTTSIGRVSTGGGGGGAGPAGAEASAVSVSERGTITTDSRTNVGDSRLAIGDSATTIPEEERDHVPADWNRHLGYQREDEELWGQWSPGNRLIDAFSKARDSAGRLIESTLGIEKEVTEQERRNFYIPPVVNNPPVNDYHPPVVSNKVPHRDAHRWMLQPPPPAKVMEGKVPVSRSTSFASRTSLNQRAAPLLDERPVGRMMVERSAAERMRSGSAPMGSELIDALLLARNNRSLTFPSRRNRSLNTSEESLEIQHLERRGRSRPRASAFPPGASLDFDSSGDDDDEEHGITIVTVPKFEAENMPPGSSLHAAQRPRLDTIKSSNSLPSRSSMSSRKGRRQRPSKAQKKKALAGVQSPVGDDSD